MKGGFVKRYLTPMRMKNVSHTTLDKPNPLFLHILRLITSVIGKLYFRITCHKDRAAIAHLGTQPRPVIVVFNHTSHLDVPVVGLCLGVKLLRRAIMPGKKELFAHPIMAWFMRQGGVIPLNRNVADTRTLRTLLHALQAGRMVIMSPEGTRSPDGTVQQFKSGFVKLAHRTRALILPVGIRGAYAALPRYAKFPRLRKITVVVGTPVDIAAHLPEQPTSDEFAASAEWIRQHVLELLNQPV